MLRPDPMGRRRRVWIWTSIALAGGLVVFILLVIAAVPLSSDALRHRMIDSLSERLDADVAIGDLHWRIAPRVHAEGALLTIRQRGVTAYPPLISIKSFTVDADVVGLVRKRVAHVIIE